jgi:hypothetical protein
MFAGFFFGERVNGLGKVACVGVRAGLRDGTVGVPGCSGSIMSWYQSYERKLKLGLGGGRSGSGNIGALLSNLDSFSSTGLGGVEPLFELSSDLTETVSAEDLLFGYWPSSYSELRLVDGGFLVIEIGGAFVLGGTYSSNRYCVRSRGVPQLRGVSLPRSELTAFTISSSKIILLLILTFTA